MLKKLPKIHVICVAAVVAAAVIYGAWRWLEQRAQNDALQKYLEQMRQLLAKEGLQSSEKDSDVRVLARSQTLTVLQGLGPKGKQTLLRFLYESHLIGKDNPIVSLAGADLSEANLKGTNLSETDLSGTNLSEVNLSEANLSKANLGEVSLSEVNLSRANLSGADLSKVNLREANLREANLSGANLSGADLSEANLSEAKDITEEQLAMCASLAGATMPDGSKHE